MSNLSIRPIDSASACVDLRQRLARGIGEVVKPSEAQFVDGSGTAPEPGTGRDQPPAIVSDEDDQEHLRIRTTRLPPSRSFLARVDR